MNSHPSAAAAEGTAGAERRPASGGGGSLYQKQEKIQTLWIRGRFQRLRNLTLTVLILFFFVLPWIQWRGHPAVLFNLPERKFVILDLTFWPQDLILLAWLLIIAAFSLFFFTVWAGRLWCGYACPQTVWTRAYVWLEHLIEGDRNQRLKLDRSPWNRTKIVRRGLKHLALLALSFWIALTAVGLFIPIRELAADLLAFELSAVQGFWLLLVTGFSYGVGTYLREQVCIYMCPYARFQGVMFDPDTLIISYDERRGEPRGKRQRSLSAAEQGKGDCIDCMRCVYACPTGIDIRDGLQIECIGCAACIDACDEIMDRMGYERGLVAYSTENQMAGVKRQTVRPRMVGYGLVLVAMLGLFAWQLATRIPLELHVSRDRARLYRETFDGGIENVYTLQIINMDQRAHRFQIHANGSTTLRYDGDASVFVEAGEMASLAVRLVAGPEQVRETAGQTVEVRFTVTSEENAALSTSEESRFIFPFR
jgi:cytochrome c oxidase accessory protein FixG